MSSMNVATFSVLARDQSDVDQLGLAEGSAVAGSAPVALQVQNRQIYRGLTGLLRPTGN
jgi:hypothetical protein